jgi:heme/copper-type cytochrome/quinol oxidase subunit 1
MLRATALRMLKPSAALARRAPVAARCFSAQGPDEVVKAEVVDSLEWTLSCPPPIHQFEEPPIIVEVEHLMDKEASH